MRMEKVECELLGWERVYALCKSLAKQVRASGYEPSVIIALARGGWFVGRVLCDMLAIKDLVSLKVEHWGLTATPDGKARIVYKFDMNLGNKRVLLVDDITDTGESMRVAADFVKRMKPLEIRTATMQNIYTTSKFAPDFVGESVKWRWFVYPWNFYEDLGNLIGKLLGEKALSAAEIRRELSENFSIAVPDERLSEVLGEMRARKRIAEQNGRFRAI